jgi:hypothetical protein
MSAVQIELLYIGGGPGQQPAQVGLRLALRAVPDALTPVTGRTEGGAGDLLGLAGRRCPSAGPGDHSVTARQIRTALPHAA